MAKGKASADSSIQKEADLAALVAAASQVTSLEKIVLAVQKEVRELRIENQHLKDEAGKMKEVNQTTFKKFQTAIVKLRDEMKELKAKFSLETAQLAAENAVKEKRAQIDFSDTEKRDIALAAIGPGATENHILYEDVLKHVRALTRNVKGNFTKRVTERCKELLYSGLSKCKTEEEVTDFAADPDNFDQVVERMREVGLKPLWWDTPDNIVRAKKCFDRWIIENSPIPSASKAKGKRRRKSVETSEEPADERDEGMDDLMR
eukprot:TRINITY_DN2392_c0_g1_i2.p1 TRINITY_DN2392_c0_g1~~TRINITY_DN2392_c0_g1_i2.p1  ORF type:complete len:262 (+),score=50.43 TRINITY_DN2392_c0_g1_i2:95-880(+)